MKKILVLVAFMALLITGCGNGQYDSYMEQGKTAAVEAKYEDAKEFFTLALEEKKDDKEATALVSQSEKIIEGINLKAEEKYSEAIEVLEQVKSYEAETATIKDAASVLIDECKAEEEKLANKIKKEIDKYITKAKDFYESQDYSKAKETLTNTIEEIKNNEYLQEQLDKSKDLLQQVQEKAQEVINK